MELFIVRHGEAGPAVSDNARELTDHGISEIGQLALAAQERGAAVVEIRHSGLIRARQTAEILAASLHPAQGVIATRGMRPDDFVEAVAQSLFEERRSLMLVSHLPFVGRLCGLLIQGDEERSPIRFPTGTMVCLRGQDDRWELLWVLRPGFNLQSAAGSPRPPWRRS